MIPFPPLRRLLGAAALGALACTLSPAAAQEPALKPGTVQLRAFIAAQAGVPAPDLALLDPSQRAVPLETSAGNLSLPLAVPAADKITLYPRGPLEKALADRAGGQKSAALPAPVAEMALVDGVRRYIVILKPGAAGREWEASLFPDTAAAFPSASYLIFNTTPYPFHGQMGTALVDVPARSRAVATPAVGDTFDVVFQTQQDGQWKPFLRQKWEAETTRRTVVVFWEYAKGDVRTLPISDIGPQP